MLEFYYLKFTQHICSSLNCLRIFSFYWNRHCYSRSCKSHIWLHKFALWFPAHVTNFSQKNSISITSNLKCLLEKNVCFSHINLENRHMMLLWKCSVRLNITLRCCRQIASLFIFTFTLRKFSSRAIHCVNVFDSFRRHIVEIFLVKQTLWFAVLIFKKFVIKKLTTLPPSMQ